MSIEVKPTEYEEYRHLKGAMKTLFWRKHKEAIIWQGKDLDRRHNLTRSKRRKR